MNMDYIIKISGPMLEGARTTVLLFLIVIVLSIPLGMVVTLMAKSTIKPQAWIAHTYIYVMRRTPLLFSCCSFASACRRFQ